MVRYSRPVLLILVTLSLSLLAACGREAPEPGELSVTSVPTGAAISINGADTGEITPHVFDSLEGGLTYRVAVTLPEFAPRALDVGINYGQRATAQFLLSSIYGSLTVVSSPAGAAIVIDGTATGEVTPHTFRLLGGTHTVRVELEGHTAFPAERTVELPYEDLVEASFNLSQQTGSLTVTSEPGGAAIRLDGAATGEVTPHTFTGLPVGDYVVSVELAGYAIVPSERTVTVEEAQVTSADFALTLQAVPRIVLLEGFSNVECTGCPAFNANVQTMLAGPSYGPDRVVFIKWVGPVPTQLDPFYLAARADMDARMSYYSPHGNLNHPSLIIDGTLAGSEGSPPGIEGMQAAITAAPTTADFRIDVSSPDLTGLAIDAAVDLVLPEAVDLTGCTLNVVLIYEEVTTARAFQTVREYHDVIRDHVVAAADLGSLAAGTHRYSVALNDPDPNTNPITVLTPNGKAVVAFVQRANRAVVQVGSTLTESSHTADSARVPVPPVSDRR